MVETKKERPLTEEKRIEIWDTVCINIDPEDRDPDEVIKEDYKGDRDAYLRVMAEWLGISIQ